MKQSMQLNHEQRYQISGANKSGWNRARGWNRTKGQHHNSFTRQSAQVAWATLNAPTLGKLSDSMIVLGNTASALTISFAYALCGRPMGQKMSRLLITINGALS